MRKITKNLDVLISVCKRIYTLHLVIFLEAVQSQGAPASHTVSRSAAAGRTSSRDGKHATASHTVVVPRGHHARGGCVRHPPRRDGGWCVSCSRESAHPWLVRPVTVTWRQSQTLHHKSSKSKCNDCIVCTRLDGNDRKCPCCSSLTTAICSTRWTADRPSFSTWFNLSSFTSSTRPACPANSPTSSARDADDVSAIVRDDVIQEQCVPSLLFSYESDLEILRRVVRI